MSCAFNSCVISTENDKEAKLVCRADGFNPTLSGHSANGSVDHNTLVVTANMGDKKYECKVPQIDVGKGAVECNPMKNEVEVIITKPNRDYCLKSKMSK